MNIFGRFGMFGDNAKKWIFLAAGIFCFILVLILTMTFRGAFAPEEIVPSAPLYTSVNTGEQSPAPVPETWAVYVTGEVNFPGVYEIEPGSRVSAAIDMAGGFSRDADREAINLAERLSDEAHISVPSKNASIRFEGERTETTAASSRNSGGVTYPSGVRSSSANNAPGEGEKIDINRADAAALATLPGIGPKLSESIVAYRDEHGPFPDVESLRSVTGIGERRLEAVRNLIRAGD